MDAKTAVSMVLSDSALLACPDDFKLQLSMLCWRCWWPMELTAESADHVCCEACLSPAQLLCGYVRDGLLRPQAEDAASMR
mmetsp:Transcript_6894/g.15043  ORF Transcript_6894/g.15043 Transcript_6894/m.15043 type:complete len:81 (-) Transcript_6894:228-470(-)